MLRGSESQSILLKGLGESEAGFRRKISTSASLGARLWRLGPVGCSGRSRGKGGGRSESAPLLESPAPLTAAPSAALVDMSGMEVEPDAPALAGEAAWCGGDANTCELKPVACGNIECLRAARSAPVDNGAPAGFAPKRVKPASGAPRRRGGVIVESTDCALGLRGPSRRPLPGVEK